MYEASCRDLGIADCGFDVMAHSLKRLERDVLRHARLCHAGSCPAVGAAPASDERRVLHERIVAAARVVREESLVI